MPQDALLCEIKEENQGLIEVCKHTHRHLVRADISHQTWDWISDNAEEIIGSGYGLAFGTWQDMAVGEMISALGRAFDKDRHTNSIPNVLRQAQTARISNPLPLSAFMDAQTIRVPDISELRVGEVPSKAIKQIMLQRPVPKNSEAIRRVIDFRNNKVAHYNVHAADYSVYTQDIQFSVNWGYDFIDAIGRAYGNTHFEKGPECPVSNMRKLAHEAGAVSDPFWQEIDRRRERQQ